MLGFVLALEIRTLRDPGEVCRFGGSELHCMGAIVGGMAAQEAIKMVTRQFVPLAGTLLYNSLGLQSASSVFAF